MMIEQIMKNKRLRPYFLAYMKARITLPKQSIFDVKPNRIRVLNQILEYEKTKRELFDELVQFDFNEDELVTVLSSICGGILSEMGTKKVMASTPELLIIKEYSKN